MSPSMFVNLRMFCVLFFAGVFTPQGLVEEENLSLP
jgi:hypothetical protein